MRRREILHAEGTVYERGFHTVIEVYNIHFFLQQLSVLSSFDIYTTACNSFNRSSSRQNSSSQSIPTVPGTPLTSPTMRAIAYLSHALALRQNPSTTSSSAASPSTPTPSTCAPDTGTGTPGSLRMCVTNTTDCEWWEYTNMTRECRELGAGFSNPSLLAPYPGGHCHFYKHTDCQDGDEVALVAKEGAPLPVPDKPK